MAARPLSNIDSRVIVNSSITNVVDNRPELIIGLNVTTTAASATWTGGTDTSWVVANNWSPSGVPATDAPIIFNGASTANLNTVLNQNFSVTSLSVTNPTGPVSIGGANTLTNGIGGIDLSAATQDLTITAPMVLGAVQTWNVASGRTLSVNGGVSGNVSLTVAGAGKVSLGAAATHTNDTTVSAGGTLKMGAANVLPNGSGKGNVVLNGTLDLNGTAQVINGLSGSGGVVDNIGGGAGILTVGSNDITSTFSGTIQNTSGSLALVKTGVGSFTFGGTNTFSGGFTNNGAGSVFTSGPAGTNYFLGIGPVVMNAGTLYLTPQSYTVTNSLTLNGASLRVGGAGSHLLTWSGPISVSANGLPITDSMPLNPPIPVAVSNCRFAVAEAA